MKHIGSVLLAAIFVAGTLQVYGQDDRPMRAPGARMLMRAMEEMKLTDDQKKEVGKLQTEMAKQQVAQFAKLATSRIELRELLRADSPDKAAIEKKINDMAQTGVQMLNQRLSQWFAVNKLLNPDQQKIWKRFLEQVGEAPWFGRGPMMGRGKMDRPIRGPMPPDSEGR